MVYSRGRGEQPVFDLVGAYDVGHPACLLVNTINDDLPTFIAGCRQVGLDICTIVALMATAESVAATPVLSVYSLENIITELLENGKIPAQQAQVVADFIVAGKEIAQPGD